MQSSKDDKKSSWIQLQLFPLTMLQTCCLHKQQLDLSTPTKKAGSVQSSESASTSKRPLQRSSSHTQSFSEKLTVCVNDSGRTIGEDHVRARYLDKDVQTAIELKAQGYSYQKVSEMMDMPIRTIRGYVDGSRRNQSIAGWKVITRWKKS